MTFLASLFASPWKLGVGLAALVAIGLAVALWRVDASRDHWRDQTYAEKAAFEATVESYRAAREEAARLDAANIQRVEAEQSAINERIEGDYQTRLADARARYERLRNDAARANPGGRPEQGLPKFRDAASGADGAATDYGFPLTARLIASEQAFQLEALIEWVREQAAVDVGNEAPVPARVE